MAAVRGLNNGLCAGRVGWLLRRGAKEKLMIPFQANGKGKKEKIRKKG